jgi:hypothetical protein
MKDASTTDVIARLRLSHLITGYCVTQAIACAAKLGIADKLADGPQDLAQLARSTASSPPHLFRLMRALCSIGLFSESLNGFHLTPMSKYLCRNTADSLLPLVELHGEELYVAFGKILENVRTGAPAWDAAFGKSIWNYFRERPDRGELFDTTMRLNHLRDVHDMVSAYDFSKVQSVADLGGGDGSLLRAILDKHGAIKGVLFDLPEVIERASASDTWENLSSRCSLVPGDFFLEMPKGIDLYIFRHVLHDWDDEHCTRILGNCRNAMHPSSRLLVIEALIDNISQKSQTNWSDLGMMIFGGAERTTSQYEKLLASAGLRVSRIIPCTRVVLIEACSFDYS